MAQQKEDYNNVHDGPWHRPGTSTGGPGGPGDMESRIARLESHVEHIQGDINDVKQDLRTLSGVARALQKEIHGAKIWAILLYVAGLGVLAKGFNWI